MGPELTEPFIGGMGSWLLTTEATQTLGSSRRQSRSRHSNPPAKQFWSVTAYDEDTRQLPVTPQGRPDISSRKEDLVKNSDGSVDVYFGREAPAGKESNWVQTVPGKGWFAYFRFYGGDMCSLTPVMCPPSGKTAECPTHFGTSW